MSSPDLQCGGIGPTEGQINQLMAALLTAMFTASLLGFLLLFGPLRRFIRCSFYNLCLLGSFLSVGNLISNILGEINPSSIEKALLYQEDVSGLQLMAMYLLILYSGQDSINALSLEDDNGYKRYIVEFVTTNGLFIRLVAQKPGNGGDFAWKISMLWLAMFLKLQERKWAFFYASKAGIARVCRVFADYMKSEHLKDTDQQINPATLDGYKYLIEPPDTKPLLASPSCQMEFEPGKIVTLENVWKCEGSLLSSDDPNGCLKDLCLSYSFFWLLLRRFAGFTLYETEITEARDKTWRLIRDGLLNKIDNDRIERTFSVIETELMFLYDFFYTKYYAAFKGGLAQFIKRCIIVVNIVSISILCYRSYNNYKNENKIGATIIIIMVLKTVMIAAIILELIQVILLVTSKWCIVKAICYYVKKELWKTRWGWFIGKSVKILNLFPALKPWQRKLGQYSLLQNYGYDSCMHRFARLWIKTLVVIPRPGQIESKSVKLSLDVKVSLLSSLCINGPELPNGVETFRRNDLPVQYFSWFCKLETQAQVILVWHIATSFCEKKIGRKLKKTQDPMYKNYKIAKDLSMYCAYLVAFSPELLRDHDDVTKSVFDQFILEAKLFFEGASCCGCVNSKSMFDKMDEVIDEAPSLKPNNIERGALLGKRLMGNIRDEEKRWKVLAEFWAELLLFLAPSDKYFEHAEYLVKGGELITHLWALLTHAGITGTDSYFKSFSSPEDDV